MIYFECMNWSEFILRILQENRMSIYDLQNKTNISAPTLYRLQVGISQRPFPNTIKKLEEGLNITIDDSDPNNIKYTSNSKNNASVKEVNKSYAVNTREAKGFNMFPIVSRVRAGEPNLYRENDIIDIAYFPYPAKTSCFALIVEGDSMEPRFSDNDIILLDSDIQVFNNNIVVAVFNDGRHTVKTYKELPEDLIELVPKNNRYPSAYYKKSDFSGIYRVVYRLDKV